jgi:hypothetical protein
MPMNPTQTCQISRKASPTNRVAPLVLLSVVCGILGTAACKPKAMVETPATPSQATQMAQTPQTNEAQPAEDSALEAQRPATLPQDSQQQASKTAASTAVSVAPSTKSETSAGGKAITIAGGWVNAGGACDSGASVFFNPDGTYMSEGEKGTWALSGKTLTVTTASTIDEAVLADAQGPDESTGESTGDSGEKAVLTLLSVTDDAARVVLSNGTNANWTRCNG